MTYRTRRQGIKRNTRRKNKRITRRALQKDVPNSSVVPALKKRSEYSRRKIVGGAYAELTTFDDIIKHAQKEGVFIQDLQGHFLGTSTGGGDCVWKDCLDFNMFQRIKIEEKIFKYHAYTNNVLKLYNNRNGKVCNITMNEDSSFECSYYTIIEDDEYEDECTYILNKNPVKLVYDTAMVTAFENEQKQKLIREQQIIYENNRKTETSEQTNTFPIAVAQLAHKRGANILASRKIT